MKVNLAPHFFLLFEQVQLPFEFNNYVFVEKIGKGSFAQAYKVFSRKYQQHFCAKVAPIDETTLDEDGNLRDSEIHALINLDHPNIIRLYEVFLHHNNLVMILELCGNGTVGDKLGNPTLFRRNDFNTFISQIFQALSYCHDQKIAHRDIKPANIFIDIYGRPKLADFGLCALLGPQQTLNTICGSASYISPEMHSGGPYDPLKADVWALGITLYQFVTGVLPFEYSPGMQIPKIAYPQSMDHGLVQLLNAMLTVSPDERLSISELLKFPFFQQLPISMTKTYSSFKNTTSFRLMQKGSIEDARIPRRKLSEANIRRIRSTSSVTYHSKEQRKPEYTFVEDENP